MRKIAWLIKDMDHKKQLVLQSNECFLDMNITRTEASSISMTFPGGSPGFVSLLS